MNEDEQGELFELSVIFDIDLEKIYHIQFVNDGEMLGEYFDPIDFLDSNDVVGEDEISSDIFFIHPIKIMRDIYMGDDGYLNSSNLFVPWSSFSDMSMTHINPSTIISMNPASDAACLTYLRTLRDIYSSDILEEKEVVEIKKEQVYSDNIVDFSKWKKKNTK